MHYDIETWKISELLKVYEEKRLDLSPPYQRNEVWTAKAQQKLLESILTGKPIPSFFLLRKGGDSFEMIDGQQRARTIIGYSKNLLVDHENLTFDQRMEKAQARRRASSEFLGYRLSITVVTEIHDNESIEEYYALLNSSGLRLNRPELKKAEYFTTNFLRLVQECAKDETLNSLRLFTHTTSARMNDVDFVSELIALIRFGISDKKEKVDQLYEDDITPSEFRTLEGRFKQEIAVFGHCNQITPIVRTRYKQKNDFYSLFHLFCTIRDAERTTFEAFYRVLVKVGPHIRPSQAECEPLREYAFHCVTQSNSRTARQARHDILAGLLLNESNKPSVVQEAVLSYFRLQESDLVKVEKYLTLNPAAIRDPHNFELDFDDEV
ncbi:MAG TPA: DUF262 domain-containing protein [Bryobacteraceae bacterium]|jgi:hypothetical protein